MNETEVKLLVGVPGSGKSWIVDRVGGGYNHVRHDDYDVRDYADALIRAADDREILAEAPFPTSTDRAAASRWHCRGELLRR